MCCFNQIKEHLKFIPLFDKLYSVFWFSEQIRKQLIQKYQQENHGQLFSFLNLKSSFSSNVRRNIYNKYKMKNCSQNRRTVERLGKGEQIKGMRTDC